MSTFRRVGFWTVLLTLTWCLLQGRPSFGSVLLGFLLALGIACWLVRREAWRPLRLRVLMRLGARVAWDIVVSNLVVARQVLFEADRLQPAWIDLPLALSDDTRVAALAAIVSLTPGTLSVDTFESEGRYWLRVHALDAPAPQAIADNIRERYETLLMEVFA